jgi:hypothetical protein
MGSEVSRMRMDCNCADHLQHSLTEAIIAAAAATSQITSQQRTPQGDHRLIRAFVFVSDLFIPPVSRGWSRE